MTEDNKFITTIFKKHPIGKNEFIYTPIKSIIVYEEEDGFYDKDGNLYNSIEDIEILEDGNSYAIDPFVISYEQYKENLEEELDMEVSDQMVLNDLFADFKSSFYHAKLVNNKIKTSTIFIDANTNMGISISNDFDSIEYDYNLAKDIEKGKFGKEELKQIRNDIYYRKLSISKLEKIAKAEAEKYIEKEELDEYEKRGIINIDKLYKQVTKTLIAQDSAAEELITELTMLEIENNNRKGILLTGDTGVGKTKLIELISQHLERPFLMIDSTQLTMPGYTGKDIEEYLFELIEKCNFNKEKAERAIVFFDEIDKKGSSKKGDVSGRGVLNQLLKFLDGETYIACKDTKSKNATGIDINTSNMIIIAGGAFTDVYNNKDSKKITGFNQNSYNKLKEITIDDFVTKAQMPREFMGRCSIIHLNNLNSKDYERILRESDESPIISAQNRFEHMDKVKVRFTDDYYKKASELAEAKKEGVRGLNGIVIKSISKPFRCVNKNLGVYKEVIIDKNTLEDSNKYQLIKRKKEKENGIQKVKK